MIKLVAVDMDGTLLDSKKCLPDQNKKTIEEYAKAGVNFAFGTGRAMCELQETYEELPAVRYAINCNGTYVRDIAADKEIYADLIEIETIRKIYREITKREPDCQFELMAEGKVYAQRSCLEHPEKYGVLYIKDLVKKTRTPVEDMEQFLEERTEGAGKVHIFFHDGEVRDKIEKELSILTEVDICHSEPTNLEITNKGINKGIGLTKLAKYLGYSMDEVMAIGDNYNDIEMLQTAGCSVAMRNAPEEVKKYAKYVTFTNDEMGVAHAIRQFCERG